ncbi:MAG: NAD(P)-binding domain-containing protein, partial [Pseudomonadota bacterium]
MARIGFVGLGNMGLPMAKNLVAAGHEVTGFDLSPDAVDALEAAGGARAGTAAEAAAGREIVVSAFPTKIDGHDMACCREGRDHDLAASCSLRRRSSTCA